MYPRETLYRVDTPYYCAGFVSIKRKVTWTAPILGWCRGKRVEEVLGYFNRKGYKHEVVYNNEEEKENV